MDQEAIRRNLRRAEAVTRRLRAPTHLLSFAQAMMPDPQDEDGYDTLYDAAPPHTLIVQHLHDLFEGRILKLAIALPPRTGKSELGCRKLIPWWLGRRPRDHIIFATYNDEFSSDMGRDVRTAMLSQEYSEIFPTVSLDGSTQSADRLGTTKNGKAVFVGRGGALTGRGFDLGVVDDLIKDHTEADSAAMREHAWKWFTRVFLTRRMSSSSRVLLIGTRWHEDDVQGRLTDPRNKCYDAKEASEWTVLRVPALSEGEEVDPLKRPSGAALWPVRFPIEFLTSQRRLDPQGFSALYQGKPTPEEGTHFRRDMLRTYGSVKELPANLTYYAASDHAVSQAQRADLTCLLSAAVDDKDNIYILPDTVWRRMPTNVQIEQMIALMRSRRPMFWWAERGHITLSLGPALRQRMRETKTYCTIDEVVPTKDKKSRSQAIHARMSLGKVFFPRFAPWWSDAENELLTFPGGAHDDFVDALSLLGLKLGLQTSKQTPKEPPPPTTGMTLRSVRASAADRLRNIERRQVRANWG